MLARQLERRGGESCIHSPLRDFVFPTSGKGRNGVEAGEIAIGICFHNHFCSGVKQAFPCIPTSKHAAQIREEVAGGENHLPSTSGDGRKKKKPESRRGQSQLAVSAPHPNPAFHSENGEHPQPPGRMLFLYPPEAVPSRSRPAQQSPSFWTN